MGQPNTCSFFSHILFLITITDLISFLLFVKLILFFIWTTYLLSIIIREHNIINMRIFGDFRIFILSESKGFKNS